MPPPPIIALDQACAKVYRYADMKMVVALCAAATMLGLANGEVEDAQLYDDLLRRMDQNGDGRLATHEIKETNEKWIRVNLHAQYVAYADTDRDGFVSEKELAVLMAQHKQRMGNNKKAEL